MTKLEYAMGQGEAAWVEEAGGEGKAAGVEEAGPGRGCQVEIVMWRWRC